MLHFSKRTQDDRKQGDSLPDPPTRQGKKEDKSIAMQSEPFETETERDPDEQEQYVYFGTFPQTLKNPKITVTNKTDEKGYYWGADGCKYAKMTATPNMETNNLKCFLNGTQIENGKEYFFKVEPVAWRILEDKDGVLFLFSKYALFCHRYAEDSNWYSFSELRYWLNDEFLKECFSERQQSLIQTTMIDNSERSANPDSYPKEINDGKNKFAYKDTQDKIFLLSMREITNEKYGFSPIAKENDKNRSILPTDYARAMGSWADKTNGCGLCWLRSPHYNNGYVACCFNERGNALYDGYVFDKMYSVVPAMKLRLSW